jgi:hypothetical protein
MNDPAQATASLPAPAARMLAVEILLADPEALGDDVLESCLYILREKLRTPTEPDQARAQQDRADAGRTDGRAMTRVLRDAEDADEGGVQDADGNPDESGGVVGEVPDTPARCRDDGSKRADAAVLDGRWWS